MLYAQICIIGLSILAIPLLNRQRGYRLDWQLFRAVVIVVMADLVFETVGWMLDGMQFAGADILLYIVNTLAIVLQPTMGMLWLYYAMEELDIRFAKGSPLHAVIALPLLVNIVLLIVNYWTGLIFAIGPDNVYVRGDLFWIDVIVSFSYPLTATILSLIAASRAKSSAKRRDCYVLASFILPPVIAAVIQVLWYGTFLFLIGFAVSLLIVFVNIQNEQITVDFLTKVNNRASFIAHYERKAHCLRAGSCLYLFMIDINYFKRINDVYGHIVGDQVLTIVADQLKLVCAGHRCFLARLGGDEFSILLECETSEQARAFLDRISSALDDFNGDSNLADPVTLSVGYAVCESGEDCSVDVLISQADAMMYTQKARQHMTEMSRISKKPTAAGDIEQ